MLDKPAGLNTHAPSPFAGDGIYDWLRHRDPAWATLAIVHRLDKETSGVLVFTKTPLANRSLTDQFTRRVVRKRYRLLTQGAVPEPPITVESVLARQGDRYASVGSAQEGVRAATRFQRRGRDAAGRWMVEAEPLTGRTHQIRVHAAERGFPILGDVRYGGPAADRVYLHAESLWFQHPESGRAMEFTAPCPFGQNPRLAIRLATIDPAGTDAFRLAHGAGDAPELAGFAVDRLGDYLLITAERAPAALRELAERWSSPVGVRGAYFKESVRNVRGVSPVQASPRPVWGETAPSRFLIRENGLRFELSLAEGYSVGLFLDQRENRRRLLTGHVGAGFGAYAAEPARTEVLNLFAYTCGFSVAAAKAGAHTVSVDLSRKYLDWGRRNFEVNHLDPQDHEYVAGDAFDWLRRFAKQGRRFGVVVVDPPTFSTSKATGRFQVEKDLAGLVEQAGRVLAPGGVLLVSTNAARFGAEAFVGQVERAVARCGRRIERRLFVPQPFDFPSSKAEPAYLKTLWLALE